LGRDHTSNVAQNAQVRAIAAKHGLTLDQARKLSQEIHRAKRSAAYDLDIGGNLFPADIEDMARAIKNEDAS
jgi:hypothetical protein